MITGRIWLHSVLLQLRIERKLLFGKALNPFKIPERFKESTSNQSPPNAHFHVRQKIAACTGFNELRFEQQTFGLTGVISQGFSTGKYLSGMSEKMVRSC